MDNLMNKTEREAVKARFKKFFYSSSMQKTLNDTKANNGVPKCNHAKILSSERSEAVCKVYLSAIR